MKTNPFSLVVYWQQENISFALISGKNLDALERISLNEPGAREKSRDFLASRKWKDAFLVLPRDAVLQKNFRFEAGREPVGPRIQSTLQELLPFSAGNLAYGLSVEQRNRQVSGTVLAIQQQRLEQKLQFLSDLGVHPEEIVTDDQVLARHEAKGQKDETGSEWLSALPVFKEKSWISLLPVEEKLRKKALRKKQQLRKFLAHACLLAGSLLFLFLAHGFFVEIQEDRFLKQAEKIRPEVREILKKQNALAKLVAAQEQKKRLIELLRDLNAGMPKEAELIEFRLMGKDWKLEAGGTSHASVSQAVKIAEKTAGLADVKLQHTRLRKKMGNEYLEFGISGTWAGLAQIMSSAAHPGSFAEINRDFESRKNIFEVKVSQNTRMEELSSFAQSQNLGLKNLEPDGKNGLSFSFMGDARQTARLIHWFSEKWPLAAVQNFSIQKNGGNEWECAMSLAE